MTTKTAKHTPGPWHINCYDLIDTPWALTGKTYRLCSKPEGAARITVYSTNAQVCDINRRSYTNGTPAIADARLIAAAPDLLEACKAVVGQGYCDCSRSSPLSGQDYVSRQAIERVRAAIAKAEGGAP